MRLKHTKTVHTVFILPNEACTYSNVLVSAVSLNVTTTRPDNDGAVAFFVSCVFLREAAGFFC